MSQYVIMLDVHFTIKGMLEKQKKKAAVLE